MYPGFPPVHTREGQDVKTDDEIIKLLAWWEVHCGGKNE